MQVSGKTKLYALCGWPIDHSLSPAIHNFLFRHFELDSLYLPLAMRGDDFARVLPCLQESNFHGFNLTTPHKEVVLDSSLPLVDKAKRIGAINTLFRDKGAGNESWRAANTDGLGFVDYIEKELGFDCSFKNLVVLGAGAASRAISLELSSLSPSKLTIMNRSKRDWESDSFWSGLGGAEGEVDLEFISLKEESRCQARVFREAELLINATSWGLGGEALDRVPWDFRGLSRESLVVDCNYLPTGEATPFMNLFDSSLDCYDGSGMLRWQAGHSFELWTGIRVGRGEEMALKSHLDKLDRP